MRLIDADKLLGLFVESGQKHGSEHGVKLGENWLLDYNDIRAVIEKAPTVDTTFREVVAYECGQKSVEERPKGKWIKHSTYKGVWICSHCNHGSNQVYDTFDFCPNCGADMKGDEI